MRMLPDQGQTFTIIREDNLLYVDKTEYIYNIIRRKGCTFLSRPRRFGKSLLIGAMEAVLQGKRDLFDGLWIGSSGYDFKPYPVIRLTMSGPSQGETQLNDTITRELENSAARNGEEIPEDASPARALSKLVTNLYLKTNERVAILIDEYDAPIHSTLHDRSLADANRRVLHDFYSVLKVLSDSDQLRLLFVTGVTKFVQTSIFSVFNNLSDLTLNPEYYGVCGFTLEEFDSYFASYLPDMLEWAKSEGFVSGSLTESGLRQLILDYYDGYSWDGKRRVINSHSLVQCLANKSLKAFWFKTGTPSFLLELIQRNPFDYVQAESYALSESSLDAVDVAQLELEPLLFQTGYLTIEKKIGFDSYSLKCPNLEVDQALNASLLKAMTGRRESHILELAANIKAALLAFDEAAVAKYLETILRWVPYQEQRALEGYHHALIYSVLKALHFKVKCEVSVSEGVFDLFIEIPQKAVFIVEIKFEKITGDKDKATEGDIK
ncbi:MAG: AAA family ATPase, partial [Deltaproteobacteria bacterium]|nr:AAA family ATPase [Deltaproteobacteria bacterium]